MPWFEHYYFYDQVLFLLLLLFVALVVFAVIFIFPVPLRYHFYLYQDVVFSRCSVDDSNDPEFFLLFFFWFSIRGTQQMFPSNTLLDKKFARRRYQGTVPWIRRALDS